MLPALKITSCVALTSTICCPVQTCAPVQRFSPLGCVSINSWLTWALFHNAKLGRESQVGRKKALAVFQRQPLRWFTSK
jgi:hypothetical protein